MSTPEQPASYDLVIPFVACKSQGGPYDDQSFVAGYQAGRIDAALTSLKPVGGTELRATIRTDLTRQIDLIAMHHGFSMTLLPCEEAPGWTFATLRRADTLAADPDVHP